MEISGLRLFDSTRAWILGRSDRFNGWIQGSTVRYTGGAVSVLLLRSSY